MASYPAWGVVPNPAIGMMAAWGEATGKKIPYQLQDRRPGDVATSYADPTLAKTLLGWEAKHDLQQMCEDHWRWQSQNPRGYS